jgi:hypothetical protein
LRIKALVENPDDRRLEHRLNLLRSVARIGSAGRSGMSPGSKLEAEDRAADYSLRWVLADIASRSAFCSRSFALSLRRLWESGPVDQCRTRRGMVREADRSWSVLLFLRS